MGDVKILGYNLKERGFLRESNLKYQGVDDFYVSKKIFDKGGMDSGPTYSLELRSRSNNYKVVVSVSWDKYDEVSKGEEVGKYSIITNEKGDIRLSKKLTEDDALKDVTKGAKKKVIQSFLVLVFLGIPTFGFLFYFIIRLF